MRKTKLVIFGFGIAWEAVSLMLPPVAAIPLLLIGLIIMAWAIWTTRVNAIVRTFPVPIQNGFFRTIKWVESLVDDTQTDFVISRPGEKPDLTYIEFNLSGPINIIDDNNIDSITDNGVGDFTVNFSQPIKGNYYVDIYMDKKIESEIVEKTDRFFTIKFEREEPQNTKLVVRQ